MYACQMWSRSDGRVEKGGGYRKIDRQTHIDAGGLQTDNGTLQLHIVYYNWCVQIVRLVQY